MKKTILAILAMTMILSSVASAGILDKLFGQGNELTGAPMAVERSSMMVPKYSGYRGSFTQSTYLKPNALSTLPNGVTVKTSSYDEHNMHITLDVSKTMTVSSNQVIKLDDGEYIVTMKNMPLTPMGISIKRKGKALGVKASTAQHSLIMKGLFEQSTFVPYGKEVKLASGFIATAERSGSSYGKLIISKSVYLANNDKVSLTDRMLEVTIDSTGVRFHTPHNSPAAFNVGQNKITGAPTAAELGTIQNLEEIAIPQLEEARQLAKVVNPGQEKTTITGAKTPTSTLVTFGEESKIKGAGLISAQLAEISLPCKDPFAIGKPIDYGKQTELGNGFTATTSYDPIKKKVTIIYTKTVVIENNQPIKTSNGYITALVADKGVYFVRGKKVLTPAKPIAKPTAMATCLYDTDCKSGYKCVLPNTEVGLNEKPGLCSILSQLKGTSEACTGNMQCLSGGCVDKKCSAIVEGDLCVTATGIKACSVPGLTCVNNRCKKISEANSPTNP